jgi:hypothetical protein
MNEMDLVRDVLDKAVVDRNGREMGRVDGIVLEAGAGGPPRVAALEIGPSVLAYRLRPVLARWIEAAERAWGVDEGRPVRITTDDILRVELEVTADVAVGQTGAENIELRLRRWVRRIDVAALFGRT